MLTSSDEGGGTTTATTGSGATDTGDLDTDDDDSEDDSDSDSDDDAESEDEDAEDVVSSIAGTYTMDVPSTISNTCAAPFSSEDPWDIVITQDGTDLGGTLDGPGAFSVVSLDGTLNSSTDTFSVSGSETATMSTCQFRSTFTISGTGDPTSCTSFLKNIRRIAGDCAILIGSGTECDVEFECQME